METRKQIYDTETMYSLCGGNSQICAYDFSLISSKNFQPFFNTLPNIIYKKVSKIQFSCDAQCIDKKSKKFNQQNQEVIGKSIYKNNPIFISYLVKIIDHVLPNTKKLKSLHFSNINFDRKQIQKIFSAIYKCKKLESISFQHIQVNDDDFIELLSHINPYQYAEVTFFDCGLTSASFSAIKQFIQKKPTTMQINRKLMIFNVDECNFTYQELEEIENMVNDAQDDRTTVDPSTTTVGTSVSYDEEEGYEEEEEYVSENVEQNHAVKNRRITSQYETYDGADVSNSIHARFKNVPEKFTFPKHHVLKSPKVSEQFSTSRKSKVSELDDIEMATVLHIDDLPSPDNMSEEEIEAQNKELSTILEKLKKLYNVTQYSDDVFVVGPNSQDFVEVIRQMKKQIVGFL